MDPSSPFPLEHAEKLLDTSSTMSESWLKLGDRLRGVVEPDRILIRRRPTFLAQEKPDFQERGKRVAIQDQLRVCELLLEIQNITTTKQEKSSRLEKGVSSILLRGRDARPD